MRRFLSVFFFIFSLFFISCGKKASTPVIDLQDSFFWAHSTKEESIEEAVANDSKFQKFDINNGRNLARLVGMDGNYVWLRSTFHIPEELRGRSLGLMISYLHFASEVYINGSYAGRYGSFPPDEHSPLYSAHFYALPEGVLNSLGENTIFIKVWCHGRSVISNHVIVTDMDEANSIADLYSSNNSRIYVMFEGGMFSAFLIFLMIWIRRKQEYEDLVFSMICLVSMFFTTPFFANEVPWYIQVPFARLMKITLCGGMVTLSYLVPTFVSCFIKMKEKKAVKVARISVWAVSMLLIMAAPDYNALIKMCIPMLIVCFLQMCTGLVFIVIHFIKKTDRFLDFIITLAFSPLIIAITADIIIKDVFYIIDMPYMAMFGWQLTIISFLIFLTWRYTKAAARSEYLNEKLEQEVEVKTQNLTQINDKLERELYRAGQDLEMASIVQKKFFPYPNRTFKGWDIATCYSPAAKVSGDLYDYYYDTNENYVLQGCSIFDVSGHGISSSLITMLAKNIIFHSFKKSLEANETVSEALYKINDQIIDAKGDIENYLTGIMFRFGEFDREDKMTVEMANAGHPNPVLYSSETDSIIEVVHSDDQLHYGAIGIKDIAINFPVAEFSMKEDDILVCFTDGLTEAMNGERQEFGVESLKTIIKNSHEKSAQSILEDIIDALYDFTKNIPRDDDLTIMVLKRENSVNFIEEL